MERDGKSNLKHTEAAELSQDGLVIRNLIRLSRDFDGV